MCDFTPNIQSLYSHGGEFSVKQSTGQNYDNKTQLVKNNNDVKTIVYIESTVCSEHTTISVWGELNQLPLKDLNELWISTWSTSWCEPTFQKHCHLYSGLYNELGKNK